MAEQAIALLFTWIYHLAGFRLYPLQFATRLARRMDAAMLIKKTEQQYQLDKKQPFPFAYAFAILRHRFPVL
nr:hypothetical protein [Plesiomonas shigelloides]